MGQPTQPSNGDFAHVMQCLGDFKLQAIPPKPAEAVQPGEPAQPAAPRYDGIDTTSAEAVVEGLFRSALSRQFAAGRSPLAPRPTSEEQ